MPYAPDLLALHFYKYAFVIHRSPCGNAILGKQLACDGILQDGSPVNTLNFYFTHNLKAQPLQLYNSTTSTPSPPWVQFSA